MKEEFYMETPLWDHTLSLEERLTYLTEQMTPEEKLKCLTTGCPDIPRLGIRSFYLGGEAAHGIEARHDQAFNAGEPEETTSFVQPIGMSATWDTELIREAGEAVGTEARILYERHPDGGLCRWAPTVDMERDPRWGRTEEGYGEDPYLAGKMASAYIRGMRGDDPFFIRCGATLKHFYANNQETDRVSASSGVDPRCQHEYYLEPFRRCIEEGGAEAVMTAYNEINGIPCIVNPQVQTLLKDTYGLPGHVVCDGGDMLQTVTEHGYFTEHAQTVAAGLKAGIDCFTDDAAAVEAAAAQALKQGLITQEDIDRSIRHSFGTRIRLGLYDRDGHCPWKDTDKTLLNGTMHDRLSYRTAAEAAVLLKNNGILPLDARSVGSIALIGPMADVWYKDWYCGVPSCSKTLLDGVKEQYHGPVHVASGYDKIRLRCGHGYVGLDRENTLILTEESEALEFVKEDWGDGSTLLYAAEIRRYVKADEETGMLKAVSKEAFGWFIREAFDLRPCEQESGRTVLVTWDGCEVYKTADGRLHFTGENPGQAVRFTVETVEDGTRKACGLAAEADVVIAAMGCNPVINSKEEIDRTHIRLPQPQERLLKRLHEVNPSVVLMLFSNYPYAVTWEQEMLPAILWSATGSQQMGSAAAAVLFGCISPAGRLNMTWYRDESDAGRMDDYDIIRGKKTYQYYDGPVLYPFGHGLSYTTFRYEDFSAYLGDDRSIHVELTVVNSGQAVSDEVVQIYVRQEQSRTVRPLLQLKAFERVKDIAPGEARNVRFTIALSELKYYDVVSGHLVLEQSDYRIMAGASSGDIRAAVTLAVPGCTIRRRDAFQKTAADHYDDCEGVRLYQGHFEENGVYAVSSQGEGRVVYQDMLFTRSCGAVRLYLHETSLAQTGNVRIRVDGADMGYLQVSDAAEAASHTLPAGITERICLLTQPVREAQKPSVVEVLIGGCIGLTGFAFLEDDRI